MSVEVSVATHVKVATLYTQGKPCPLILDKVEGNLQGGCGEWRRGAITGLLGCTNTCVQMYGTYIRTCTVLSKDNCAAIKHAYIVIYYTNTHITSQHTTPHHTSHHTTPHMSHSPQGIPSAADRQ